jgi:hypothetical protein
MQRVLISSACGLVLSCASLISGGCATNRAQVVTPATDAQRAELLDTLKSLEGTWTMDDENGQTITASVFTVSSGGSVVREIMFPGQPHEMTNVYHMDGPDMVVTHYCAVGNQPRMRATPGNEPGTIAFEFDSVTNMTKPDEHRMSGLVLVMKDQDHIVQKWTSFSGDKATDTVEFELTRAR